MAFDYSASFAGINNGLMNLGKSLQEQRTTNALLQAFDQSTQPSPAAFAVPPAQSLATLGQPTGYFAQTRSAESSGNDAARNPASTATGRYQFLQGTWNGLMKSNPELGLTADGRADPQQQERAMRAFTAQNAQVLQSKGIQPTDGNLYMAHFLGAGAAPNFINAVQQDPSVPATALVTPQVAAANKGIFFNSDGTPKSAGEVYQRMAGRYGDGSTAVAAIQGAAPQADLPAQGAVPTEGSVTQGAAAGRLNTNSQMIRALLANPSTRADGLQLWQQIATGKQFGFQVVGDQLYRTDPRTGTVEPVGVSKPVTPVTVSEGQTLVDPRTGQVVYQGQAKEKNPVSVPEGGTLVNPQTGEVVYQGAVGNKARQDIATREQIANEQGYQGEDRKFFIANGKLPTAGEKTTEGQANAALYADRMKESDAILSQPDITNESISRTQRTLSGVPIYGNSLVSPKFQQAEQAKRDFINATLRRESGAAISPSEFESADKQYFPQPGDSPQVLAQKARNRQTAITGISNAAGPSYAKRQSAQSQPQYREGQRASNGQQTIIFRNGQWVPE